MEWKAAKDRKDWRKAAVALAVILCALWGAASLFAIWSPAPQPNKVEKGTRTKILQWAPANVEAPIRSLSVIPPCDLSSVLEQAGAKADELAANLEKFSAEEQIQYRMLDRRGSLEETDAATFAYVFAFEQHNGGSASREYRTPTDGSHAFRASGQDTGQAALALIFHPNMQADYQMRCEGLDNSLGQPTWVVHFQQRKDRPGRTLQFSVDNVSYSAKLKGRAWISTENFQIIHLETNLLGDIPMIKLRNNAVSVDYAPVQVQSKKLELWLPQSIEAYWEFENHRVILVHTYTDFHLFTVETEETVQEPKDH